MTGMGHCAHVILQAGADAMLMLWLDDWDGHNKQWDKVQLAMQDLSFGTLVNTSGCMSKNGFGDVFKQVITRDV